MQPIEFLSPKTVTEACSLLEQHGHDAKVLAGGQSLVQLLKQRLVNADRIIHIGAIPELQEIKVDSEMIWIGAGVTYDTVRRNADVRRSVPILPETIATIGDEQIRSQGTFVGGVVHADPQGDPPVVATALDATIRVQSTDGKFEYNATDFFIDMFETELGPTELVTEIGVPRLDEHALSAYRAYAPRAGDYAVVSVATVLERTPNGEITDASVVAGAVDDTPVSLPAVETLLEGQVIDGTLIAKAGSLASETEAAVIIDDEEWSESYRRSLLNTLVTEALSESNDK